MIHPSYIELMNIANEGCTKEEPVVNSRYSIVIAAAKRARQLIDDADPMIEDAEGEKALSIAVKELYEGRVRILPEDAVPEETFFEADTEPAAEEPDVLAQAGAAEAESDWEPAADEEPDDGE